MNTGTWKRWARLHASTVRQKQSSGVPGASTILARAQEQQLIVNALRQIPLEQQILLELYYWEQLKAPQLAELINVNASTMRTRIQVARDVLRAAITKLAANPALIESTVTRLDDWAEQVRAQHLHENGSAA